MNYNEQIDIYRINDNAQRLLLKTLCDIMEPIHPFYNSIPLKRKKELTILIDELIDYFNPDKYIEPF